jgi:hypothetical protein
MTQLSPNTSIYAKALARLREVNRQNSDGEYDNPEEYYAALQDILHEVYSEGERPNLFYDFIEHGEPPLSRSNNRFWESLSTDVNIIYDQLNYTKAHTIAAYNSIVANIKKSSNQNDRVKGKLKTLQLYSSSTDNSVRIFGDFFSNYDFVDLSKTPNESRGDISDNTLTLGKTNEVINLLTQADVFVNEESNGFAGRLQEIVEPTNSPTNPVDGELDLIFFAESDPHNDLETIIDTDPSSWFEYEANWVSENDRLSAKNFGFRYRNDIDPSKGEFLNWATGPGGTYANSDDTPLGPKQYSIDTPLKLVLDMDLGSLNKASKISYVPHKITPLGTHPVRVNRVLVSPDGANWVEVSSGTTWIASDINLENISSNETVYFGSAVWQFQEQTIRYVKIEIEQIQAFVSKIGHLYYETTPTTQTTEDDNATPNTVVIPGERIEGPIPILSRVSRSYTSFSTNAAVVTDGNNGYVQKREYFDGYRWAIGVRDISVESVRYKNASTIISAPFRVDGIVDRVALEADYDVPSSFNTDQEWVKFYVSPNNGIDWYRISNIQNDKNDIPEIISFNDPIPEEFHEPGVAYYSTNDTVDTLLVRIDIERPADKNSSTPVIRNYKLKALKR